MHKFFSISKRIYYHDTDCGGVVYYANYLKYLEEGRTEFFTKAGVDLKDLSNKGIFFVVGTVDIKYKSPARYQDTIEIITEKPEVKTASMYFLQKIAKESTVLVEAKTVLVCINEKFRPQAVPDNIKEKIEKF